MASAGAGAGEDPPPSRLFSIPKEGERILAPTRRPDGTLRKPIRIRAGYVPQDEVAIYQPKGALLRKASEPTQPAVPPGYDPALAEKPKTKSAKRNERKKEKRHQAALEKEKNLDSEEAEVRKTEVASSSENIAQREDSDVMKAYEVPRAENIARREESVELVTEHISRLSFSATPMVASPSTDTVEIPKPEPSGLDLDKKIRALKKKIRLAEALLQGNQQRMKPEQVEKMQKVEGWRDELKLLEDRKANSVS